MPRRNLLILLAALAISYACYVRGEQNPYARYVSEGLEAIEQGALERVPNRELFEGAMEGMVGVLRGSGDEYSQFLSAEEAEPLRTDIRQQFGGIGVRIGFKGEPPRLAIVGPPDPGTPAARANLLPGDRITEIDGQSTADMDMAEVLQRMRGAPGTAIRLSIKHEHEQQPRSVKLVREVINLESILGDRRRAEGGWHFRLERAPQIAHVRIASFGDRTPLDLARTLHMLTGAGVRAVVLDMRDNAGGSLDAAVAVCEMLLPAGKIIVETRGRGETLRRRYTTTDDGPFLQLPVAVLVNQNSASAAEIVAAALQDHGRAIVVGERTYGKGTVQQLLPLESGRSLLKLTWANFWRPNGARIHRETGAHGEEAWGVVPTAEYQRSLTAEEYAAYREYRARRDLLSPDAAEEAIDAQGGIDDVVDEQLQLAVDYLQQALDERAP